MAQAKPVLKDVEPNLSSDDVAEVQAGLVDLFKDGFKKRTWKNFKSRVEIKWRTVSGVYWDTVNVYTQDRERFLFTWGVPSVKNRYPDMQDALEQATAKDDMFNVYEPGKRLKLDRWALYSTDADLLKDLRQGEKLRLISVPTPKVCRNYKSCLEKIDA